jgi:hypothetical protein
MQNRAKNRKNRAKNIRISYKSRDSFFPFFRRRHPILSYLFIIIQSYPSRMSDSGGDFIMWVAFESATVGGCGRLSLDGGSSFVITIVGHCSSRGPNLNSFMQTTESVVTIVS